MKYTAITLTTLLASALARPGLNDEFNVKARAHARDVRTARDAPLLPRWNARLGRREVPQEKSHQKFVTGTGAALNLNNPDGIVDHIFGLLGNGAAAGGAGKITDLGMYPQLI